jgi:hypothetical protein
MPLLQNYLGALCSGPEIRGPKFGARSSGPEVRGPTFVVQIYQKIFDYIIRNHIYEFLFYKVAWGTPHSGPGIRRLWHRYAKNHLITSLLFVYMCFYMSLVQNYLGARYSGPEFCGTGMPKNMKYYQNSHICVSICLCYKIAWGHPVRGLKFGARLFWHRYRIMIRWIETHICALLLLWDKTRNPII